MKIQILSDLHTEFEDYNIPKTDADVIVLAGDIGVKMSGLQYALRKCKVPTIYVAGNHEYYGAAIPQLTEKLRLASNGTNVHFLENQEIIIGSTRFLGCTLWTDFLLLGTEKKYPAMWEASEKMTDFRRVRRSPVYRKLRPVDTIAMHYDSIAFIQKIASTPFNGRTVVVTHHAPLEESIGKKYDSIELSAAYASKLDELFMSLAIDVWIHGHTHHCMDFYYHKTRVVSNQRGYPDDPVKGFDGACVIEI